MTVKIQDVRQQMPFNNPTRRLDQITKIGRHHSGTSDGDVHAFLRHWRSLGWGTGGYGEVILRDGTVQLCYDPTKVTNGIYGHNTNTYHICVVGNGSFTEAQEKAFLERAKVAIQLFNLQVKNVLGHNEFSGHESNACPGIDMNKVRANLTAYISNKKEGEEMLKLSAYQWQVLEQNVGQLIADKVITDKSWVEKVKNKSLSVSELAWLNNVILMRLTK